VSNNFPLLNSEISPAYKQMILQLFETPYEHWPTVSW
jgi:hypothetical protein